MKNKVGILILSLLFVAFLAAPSVFAVDRISRDDLRITDSIHDEVEIVYARPSKILITQIGTENSYLTSDTASWLRLFYYYSITRLGFPDIPFNYIIDRQGNVYEGVSGYEGTNPYLNTDGDIVLVGYFSQTSDISLSSRRSLEGLLGDYAYRYGISVEDVLAVELELMINNEEISSLAYNYSDSIFNENIIDVVRNINFSDKEDLVFVGNVTDVEYPNQVTIGERLTVNLVLKNEDSFTWYVDEGLVFLSTVDNLESSFAINREWDSFTKPFALEPQVIPFRQEIPLSFELGTEYAIPGKYKETFEFVMIPDRAISGTKFDVEFEVIKGDAEIIEIQRVGTVYDCPRYNCAIVAVATSGDRYVVLAEENGWYKIYVDGVEGWVIASNTRKVD